MKRKTFVKQVMALGLSRNVANKRWWMPIVGPDGETAGKFAFCPHCGMMLSQLDIDGKKIGEKECRNCGTEITWEETQKEYPHKFGLNLGEWLKQDDL